MIKQILKQFNIDSYTNITRMINIEDGSYYDAWKIEINKEYLILKKAKEKELEIYKNILTNLDQGVPEYISSTNYEDANYILTTYVEGKDLCKCDKDSLIKVLDTLIYLQNKYWKNETLTNIGYTFESSKQSRNGRLKHLNDAELEKEYLEYLKLYNELPKTLCHDDLLPFNVIINEYAYIIDWEVAGILPYPSSLVRLIAHGKDDENYLFYMTDEDKEFAIEYYYYNFIINKGISKEEYLNAIDYFLLYEYCEWIMLGNKYQEVDRERFNYYLEKAKKHIMKMHKEKK